MTKTLSIEFIDKISNITCFVGEYEENTLKDVFGWIKKLELTMDSVDVAPILKITFPNLERCSVSLKYKLGLSAIKLSKWGVTILWED